MLAGNGGNDVLAGIDGNDTLSGGQGSDTLAYSAAGHGVTVNLVTTTAQATVGAGSDTVDTAENVIGSAFADTLTGSGIANSLAGGGGDDTAHGRARRRYPHRRQGPRYRRLLLSRLGVTVDLSLARAQVTRSAGADTLREVENVTGGAGRDTLRGNGQANILTGGAGNDTLAGRGGGDLLDGGTGIDVGDYTAARRRVIVNLNTGSASAWRHTDTLVALENATGGRARTC